MLRYILKRVKLVNIGVVLWLLAACGANNTPTIDIQPAITSSTTAISRETPTPVATTASATPTPVSLVAWSPNGKILALARGNKVQLRDNQGNLITTLVEPGGGFGNLAWSPDDYILAADCVDGNYYHPLTMVHTIKLWKSDGTLLATLTGHTDDVMSLDWSPDSTLLASGSHDKTVRLWSAKGKAIAVLTGHTLPVFALAWSPDGKILASGSEDATVRLWDKDGKAIAVLTGHTQGIYNLAWSPDGTTLASGSSDETGRLWSSSGKSLATLTGHTGPAVDLAWSHSGKLLALGSTDGTVQIWDATGKLLTTYNAVTDEASGDPNLHSVRGIAWSPDDSKLAISNHKVQLLSADGQLLKTLDDHPTTVYHLAWSSQGVLAAGYIEGSIRLWDKDGNPLRTINL